MPVTHKIVFGRCIGSFHRADIRAVIYLTRSVSRHSINRLVKTQENCRLGIRVSATTVSLIGSYHLTIKIRSIARHDDRRLAFTNQSVDKLASIAQRIDQWLQIGQRLIGVAASLV